MQKFIEKVASGAIYAFCFLLASELLVNYFAFYYLFPIKNSTSYGYITRKTQKTIIPLNKYSSRLKAQLALPYELIATNIKSNKELIRDYDKILKDMDTKMKKTTS